VFFPVPGNAVGTTLNDVREAPSGARWSSPIVQIAQPFCPMFRRRGHRSAMFLSFKSVIRCLDFISDFWFPLSAFRPTPYFSFLNFSFLLLIEPRLLRVL
jgi:hypothetical protein